MKHAFFILMTLTTYSCGAKKIALENADTLISYQITKRLPLESVQKEKLDKDIDRLLEESKPKFQSLIPLLTELGNDNERINEHYHVIESFYLSLAQDFAATLSKYLSVLDKKQQSDLFKTLEEENKNSSKKKKEKILDTIEGRIESFIGPLNQKQKKILKEYKSYFYFRHKDRLEHKIKLHHTLHEIYDTEKPTTELFQNAILTYQKESLKNNKNLEIIKKFVPTLTKDQQEHFKNEILEINDLLKYFKTIKY